MASGVAALVRHLPAGRPSIFYCIHSLVEKATTLCSTVSSHDNDLWKNWEGELEPAKKVIDLLLRLLSLVDIQVRRLTLINFSGEMAKGSIWTLNRIRDGSCCVSRSLMFRLFPDPFEVYL